MKIELRALDVQRGEAIVWHSGHWYRLRRERRWYPGTMLTPNDLLEQAAVLAVAPPWTGKTTVAKGISKALKAHRFSELTCFEERERGAPVAPPWWEDWRASGDEAFWIVDGLDEDARKDKQSFKILQLIEGLPEEARARLHLITFCRTNEIPGWFENGLEELCGAWSPDDPLGLRRLRLVGLDRETARAHVGPSRFDRVCQLIRSNDLQTLAPLPAVLTYLADQDEGESLTRDGVWEGVLKDLLREKRDDPLHPSLKSEVEDRFAVAQRLAALTTFCGVGAVQPEAGLESLFPAGVLGSAELRLAAREAWRMSIFERSDRGYRFSQDHVRQWLTTFALRGMTLLQLRPLLSREGGELEPAHEGVVGLLVQISLHQEVRDWLVTAHGGLPGAEDATWSLPDAARALDKLQDVARSSPWGLSVWRQEGLESFGKVPGMGAEIARRLELDLHPAEQQLLLELALVIDAQEPVVPAARILQDGRQDERVRERSASLVAALGTAEHLAPLASWVEAMQETPGKAILSTLEVAFYEKGLWSFEKAAERALSGNALRNDWLQYRLADELTLDRARWLIGNARRPKRGRRLPPLLANALEKLQEQETLEREDIALLVSLLLERADDEERGKILRLLGRSPAARRALFQEGLSRDPQGQGEEAWVWRNVLNGEDAGWLLDLFLAREDRPAWMSEILYFVAYHEGAPPAVHRHVRRVLRDADAGKLAVMDQNRRKWNRKQDPAQKETPPVFELTPLVRETLESQEIELRHKMLRLSWYCFEPPSQRPSNLSGRWEDLPAGLRGEVMAVCREALAQCPPTLIPASASYSRWTSWEAACFDRLANEDAGFVLMPAMIRKWLPALLRDWVSGSGYEPTLRRCFEVDRHLAEDLFTGEVRRAVLAEKSTYVLQNLPRELWSERFSGLLEPIVSDMDVAAEMRIDLLVRIAWIFPVRAQPIALAWAEGPDASLRDAGIDLLLMVAPEEGWRHLQALAERENPKDVLLRMRSLLPHHYGPSATFDAWPSVQLARLEELLLSCFPPEDDPQWEEGQVRSLGEEDDLLSVRDHLPQLLYRRDGAGDHETLEALADRHRYIREWLNNVRAQQGAESVISSLGRGTHPPGEGRRVPLPLMLKLLQETHYRVLGSADDLHEVILEQLRLIETEAKQHLSLLYHPRPSQKGQKRRRLHEDALQAYLACRLSDRLPGVVAGQGVKVVFVNRETLAARDTRNDLKIQAISYEGKPLTVILEVKWSDNEGVSTSLVDQLGEDYLLQNNLTHGIYLVGWSGATQPWKSLVGSAPEPRSSLEAWQKALAEQAELFCQAHCGLRITPLMMDLTWDPEPG
jgi:hypothetical protein